MQRRQPPAANNHQAEAEAVAMVCLQVQQLAGLPDAAEGRHVHLSTTSPTPAPAAAAVCRAGVADFHRQVLLLHCAPVSSIDAVTVTVTMAAAATCSDPAAARVIASVRLDLAAQLRRHPCPSPSVLSFVLGGGVSGGCTAAGALVLSLTLHHRLLVTNAARRTGCGSLLRGCLRVPLPLAAAGCCPPVLRTRRRQNNRRHYSPEQAADDIDCDGDGGSSSGFITIEKGTISRRRPPSDYLLTTDDDDNELADGKRLPPPTTAALDDDANVENDFLAMLMLEHDEDDDDLDDLDAFIKEAEAHLAATAMWPSRG